MLELSCYLLISIHFALSDADGRRQLALVRARIRRLHRGDQALSNRTDFLASLALAVGSRGVALARLLCAGDRSADIEVRSLAAMAKSNLAENSGNTFGALRYARQSYDLAVQRVDHWAQAMALIEIASARGFSGTARSILDYQRAIALLAEFGARDDVRQVQSYLVNRLLIVGRVGEARAVYEDMVSNDGESASPESTALQSMCRASILLAEGDDVAAAEIFARAADHVSGHLASGSQDRDPLLMFIFADAVCGMIRAGNITHIRERMPVLARCISEALFSHGFRDLPRAGSSAMALGVLLCECDGDSELGARLLLTGHRLRPRRDFVSIEFVVAHPRSFSRLSDEKWENLSTDIALMSTPQAVDHMTALLEEVQNKIEMIF